MPNNLFKILDRLPIEPPAPQRPIYIPPDQIAFNLLLLYNSPFNGIELHILNAQFVASLRKYKALRTPIYRYAERITRLCETQNAIIAL